tara:strand:+ start:2426 stop:2599 length:174 start_codon:yes stop_codon:yes gene_type:complete
MNVVWTDKECHKAFKEIGSMIGDLQKLIQLAEKRISLLEQYNYKKPLVLTKEMEVKN